MIRICLAALAAFLLSFHSQAEDAMTSKTVKTYQTFDGQTISYSELGTGPTVLLLHGFTANAETNWFGPGIAQDIAAAGYRVIAPDFRGHGASPVPNTPESWPTDAVARDQIALMAHLETEPYAIVGYSMGAITALRLHLLSRMGQRMVLGGVGDSVADEFNTDRNTAFRAAIEAAIAGEDSPAAKAILARAEATGADLHGLLAALSSRTYTPVDLLATFDVPTLVLTGDKDLDNGSGPALAALIPGARYEGLTGTHISAVGDPALARKVIAFLAED